jgi:hypothetical protein
MSNFGCSLEEAWGKDFSKPKKKKSKKKRPHLSDSEIGETIDPEILIPDTREWKQADVRAPNVSFEDTSDIGAYDNSSDAMTSMYQRYATDPVQTTNESVLTHNKGLREVREVREVREDMVQISKAEYKDLQNKVVEGFGNNVDEQFNQLLLYIFTGLFFIVMMDTMYQLGKKSY